MTEAPRLARCVCGALSFRVTGAPVHLHACTCTRCQRKSGSVMLLSGWFAEAEVAISGPYTTFTKNPDRPDDMVGFCPTCGTGHFFRSGGYLPGTVAISIGSFADPDFPAPAHIHWWPDRPHWLGAPHGPELLPGN